MRKRRSRQNADTPKRRCIAFQVAAGESGVSLRQLLDDSLHHDLSGRSVRIVRWRGANSNTGRRHPNYQDVSPRPRSPIIELCGASIGSLSRARRSGFVGDKPEMLVGGRNFLGSVVTAAINAFGIALTSLKGKRIRRMPSAPIPPVERALPRARGRGRARETISQTMVA
jgi:hypothetical protein